MKIMFVSIKVLRFVIIVLTFFSLFVTYYEYDNSKRSCNDTVFMHNEGLLKNYKNVEELFISESNSCLYYIMIFKQLLFLNLIIVGLVIIYFWLERISSSQSK